MDVIPLSSASERAYCRGAVGVLDSGVGGLSVLVRLAERMPRQPYLYFADGAWCPYGPRAADAVRDRVFSISEAMVSLGCAVVVLACNTATSAAVEHLRGRLDVPVVGMEPAVKPAVEATRSGHIAVLGTRGTLHGAKLHRLEAQFGFGVSIHHIEGVGLVELVEEGHFDDDVACSRLEEVLAPLSEYPIDQLVLGCTHYPFLRGALAKVLPSGVAVIDPAPAVAQQTERVYTQLALGRAVDSHESSVLFSSSAGDLVRDRARLSAYFQVASRLMGSDEQVGLSL